MSLARPQGVTTRRRHLPITQDAALQYCFAPLSWPKVQFGS